MTSESKKELEIRFKIELEKIAKEEVKDVEVYENGAVCCLCSELAALRLYCNYSFGKNSKVFFSENLKSWAYMFCKN